MPRPPGITYAEFSAAARDVLARGERPTLDRVRAALGGRGGTDVLRRYLDQFLSERLAETSISAVPASLQALYAQALDEARRQVQGELASQAQQLEAERKSLTAEREQWLQRVARAEALAQANAERLDQLQREHEQLHARIAAERGRSEGLEQRLAAAQETMAVEREAATAALDAARAERAELLGKFVAQVDRTTERLEGVQQHMLRMVDEIRTGHVAAVDQALATGLKAMQDGLRVALERVSALPARLVPAEELQQQLQRQLEPIAAAAPAHRASPRAKHRHSASPAPTGGLLASRRRRERVGGGERRLSVPGPIPRRAR
jgi:chromosome segregation ATPase